MPLFGLIKKNKKTKDQPSSTASGGGDDDKTSTSSSHTAGGAAPIAAKKTASNASSAAQNKKLNKTKSEQSQLTPVRTISHKTPNPFTAPVNIPKSPTTTTTTPHGLSAPTDVESTRMYSSSPFSSSPTNSASAAAPNPLPAHPTHPHQPQHVHNVVAGQYNAPPTPPSTARSGSIDDKLDLSVSSNHQQPSSYHDDHLSRPQPQQPYNQYSDIPSSNAMIGTPSGLLTPIQSISDRMASSNRYASAQESAGNAARQTKGKYAINDFAIQRTLGTGSFGRVHLVQSRHNHRFYAIKVLKKNQVVKMKQVEHTNDERAMLQLVRHPFLINLWGTFQDSKNLYMVMDFIEGGELFSLLRKSQRFPNAVAKFYAAEVVLAINYLHGLDIIYRDLKPENLLLDRHGHIKITDFGFAKKVPDITWTLCGTPDYLAPEVVASKGYNKSVDWWSLGILTFEMLAGYPPFYDQNPMKLYENIMNGRVKYPSYFETLARDLLQKLLTADLSKRYGNLKRGSADIFEHAWFAEVNWERLERREIDAPYVPPIRPGGGDASQFEKYDEESEEYGDFASKDPYAHLFQDF